MRKNIIFFIIFCFISSCGYNSLYKNNDSKNFKFNFKLVRADGDKNINNNILSALKSYSDKNLKNIIEIKLNSSYTKSSVSRDKKGKTSQYNIVITTDFYLISNNEEIKKITITEKIGIKNISDAFQQKKYERKIKKDLSRSVAQKFVEKLSTYK